MMFLTKVSANLVLGNPSPPPLLYQPLAVGRVVSWAAEEELGFEPTTVIIVILPVGGLYLLVKRAARMSWTGGGGKTASQRDVVTIQLVC